MSQSPSQDPLGRSPAEIAIEVTLAILVCLASMLGNLLVVYVINKDSRLNNVTNIFIHNLTLTDIATATIYMPFWVVSMYTGTWIFSQEWCEVSGSILSTLCYTSILTMGLIALNRYITVVKPALYSKLFPSKRAARLYCVLVWLVAILFATSPLYGLGKYQYHSEFSACTFSWHIKHIAYTILIVGGLVNGATIAIFYSYYNIYKAVKESAQNMNAHGQENGVNNLNNNRADMKLLKTCFTVSCFFVMTWGPGSIVIIFETLRCNIPHGVYMTVVYLMFSGSFVNPIIYGIMNPQFKTAFKKALRCGRYGDEDTNQSHTGNATIMVHVSSRELERETKLHHSYKDG